MTHAVIMLVLAFGLFLGMLLFLEIGRRIGVRRMKDDSVAGAEASGPSMAPSSPSSDCSSPSPSPERRRDSTRGGS